MMAAMAISSVRKVALNRGLEPRRRVKLRAARSLGDRRKTITTMHEFITSVEFLRRHIFAQAKKAIRGLPRKRMPRFGRIHTVVLRYDMDAFTNAPQQDDPWSSKTQAAG